jgi:hypothetical protein
MRVAAATAPGSAEVPNEDAVCFSENVAAVVDGVTAPAGLETGCQHGTPWYANQLASELVAVSSDTGRDLQTALSLAISRVADLHRESCDLTAVGTPSATVALVRQREQGAEYLVLSDATVAIRADGALTVVTDDRLAELLTEPRRAVQSAPADSEIREQRLHELVTAQRKLRNVPGGYWLAGAIPEAAEHALTGSVAARTVRAVVMTDGAARLVDMFHACSWAGAIDALAANGPESWIEHVRQLEESDRDMTRWPRYKVSDDAALAWCTFEVP